MDTEPHPEPGSQNRSCIMLAGLLGAVLLVVLVTALLLDSTDGAQMAPGLQRQAAAVRPENRAELEKLAQAPQYHLEAVIDPESGQYRGELRLAFTNRAKEPLDTLVFRLFPNAASIYGGGSLAVAEVRQGDTPLEAGPSPNPTILPVALAQPLEPGQRTSLTLAFSGQAPVGAAQGYGIFGRHPGSISLAGWYPVLAVYDEGWQTPAMPAVGDALEAETSFYTANLALPAGYRLASSGSVVSTATLTATLPLLTGPASETAASALDAADGGWVAWQVASGPTRELAAAAVLDGQVLSRQVDGITLRLFYRENGETGLSPEAGLELAASIVLSYNARFGPYPFNELDIVESPITIDGYEFSGMAIIDPQLRAAADPSSYEYILAHELAHQWWYGLAGNKTVEEPWLDEAHASYSAVLFFEDAGRPEAAAALLSRWEEIVSRLPEPLPVDSPALGFTDWGAYRDIVYLRGALFIHALRQELGDENFSHFLRRYQEEARYGMGSTERYLALAEETAGQELDAFYQPWFGENYSN